MFMSAGVIAKQAAEKVVHRRVREATEYGIADCEVTFAHRYRTKYRTDRRAAR